MGGFSAVSAAGLRIIVAVKHWDPIKLYWAKRKRDNEGSIGCADGNFGGQWNFEDYRITRGTAAE